MGVKLKNSFREKMMIDRALMRTQTLIEKNRSNGPGSVRTDFIDSMSAGVDAEFAKCLGTDTAPVGGWTAWVVDTLVGKGVNSQGAYYEDMVTDIINGILMALQGGALKDKVDMYLHLEGEDLLNKLRPIFTASVMFRFRDFRQSKIYQIGGRNSCNIKIKTKRPKCEQIPMNHIVVSREAEIGSELDVENLKGMISAELNRRASAAPKGRKRWFSMASQILPDRFDGMGLREICVKHGFQRGSVVSSALNEIYGAVLAVAERLNESWMINFITKG